MTVEATATNGERPPIFEVEGLRQRLVDGRGRETFVLDVDRRLTIRRGDLAAILGPSGCGKTTLLTVLGLMRSPSFPKEVRRFSLWIEQLASGTVQFNIRDAWIRGQSGLIEDLRRRHFGFALQSGELVSSLNVEENVGLPLRLNGIGGRECRQRVRAMLTTFGLRPEARRNGEANETVSVDLTSARINRLSGGQYQRVALARALAHRPRIVFVDEPTAALNREMARGAIECLRQSVGEGENAGAAIVITHDEELANEFATLIIRMAPRKDRPAGEVVEVIHR